MQHPNSHSPIHRDKLVLRRASWLLLFGAVIIWCGLVAHSANQQIAGEALCASVFGWVATGGWRVLQRCIIFQRDNS